VKVFGDSTYEATKPVPATAIVIDLRNFTPNLKASQLDHDGVDQFSSFLAKFHALCIDAAMLAMPPALQKNPPLHIASTGDGMIMVFLDADRHFAHGYLASLLLHKKLETVCEQYNAAHLNVDAPPIWFGIGVDTGTVSPVMAGVVSDVSKPSIHTVLGNCINIAARAQGITKLLAGSRTIVAGNTFEYLCDTLLQTDFRKLKAITTCSSEQFCEKTKTEREMSALNHQLCVKFLHLHHLKGVDKPVDLYRVSESALHLENPTFDVLLNKLSADKPHATSLKAIFAH
jgi:class 3 adenylate cyclase